MTDYNLTVKLTNLGTQESLEIVKQIIDADKEDRFITNSQILEKAIKEIREDLGGENA